VSNELTFVDLLDKAKLNTSDVRLLRHQRHGPLGQTPYSLWMDDPLKLNHYQSLQRIDRRTRFNASFWASFVVTPQNETLFVGLFSSEKIGPAPSNYLYPFDDKPLASHEIVKYNYYRCVLTSHLASYIGRVVIDWGPGTRSWVQRADSSAGFNKTVVEIRQQFKEPDFPGYQNFIHPLSAIPSIPHTWKTALSAVKGIYLLTCPKTKEQYVGKASGPDGFWGRWMEYYQTGHGGNVAMKARNLSDYQISILDICSLFATEPEILALESLWKQKLQSREMGLNRN